METSDPPFVPYRGCPEHRRQRSFQLGRPKRGDTRLNAHGWVGLGSSRPEGRSGCAMDAVWNRDTPADKDGPDTYPWAADAWVHAAIVRAGHAGVLLGDNPGRGERVPGPREAAILWNALPRFNHDACFTTVASEFTECSKVLVSTLPRAVLWDFFATAVHLRHKLLIIRLVKRLLATVVDEAAHTVRWICDAPHEDHGITPLVLERLCGGLRLTEPSEREREEVAAFKFAQAVGFLVARCNKVTMCTALFHAVLYSPAFAGEVGDFWRSVLHSDTVRHVLAVCVLAAMDALFAGTWYMYDGEAPLPGGEKCLGLSRSERQVRYNRWRTFCDLALTIVGDAMPSEVVVHTPRTLQTGRSGRTAAGHVGANRVVPILRQTGVSDFGWGGGLALGEDAGGFKTNTVPALRIAFEASRVHDWPYLAMMGLPSRTFRDVTLWDTFFHIYNGEPEPGDGNSYDPLEPPPVSATRRLRFLELTYRKLIEHAHDERATLSERNVSSKFLRELWINIALIEPKGVGIVEERRHGDFERLVRRLLRCTPPPEQELAGSGAFTVCSVVDAMADCLTGGRTLGAQSTTVYLDAIAAIADADVRFLRAARPLAGWSNDGFVAKVYGICGDGTATELGAIPVRQLRAVFDLLVRLNRECDRVGTRCKGLPHPDSDPESDGLPHDLVAEFHAEPSDTAGDPGETQRLLAAAQLLATAVAAELDSLSAEPSPILESDDRGLNLDIASILGRTVVTIDCLDWMCASIASTAPTEAKGTIEFRDWSCTELRPEHIGFVEAHTTGAAIDDEADEGSAPPSPAGRRVGRAGVDHTASVLSRFIIYRAPQAYRARQWWTLTPQEAAAFDEDTSTALRQMLRIAPWSQADLQWALAVAASWCHTAAAEVLLQPFHDHPHGLSASSVPEYMLECALVVKVENTSFGNGNHTPLLGTVEEAREWLTDVAEPLWAPGGAATSVAGLGAGMKRKHDA